jgi:hypothetical protein
MPMELKIRSSLRGGTKTSQVPLLLMGIRDLQEQTLTFGEETRVGMFASWTCYLADFAIARQYAKHVRSMFLGLGMF